MVNVALNYYHNVFFLNYPLGNVISTGSKVIIILDKIMERKEYSSLSRWQKKRRLDKLSSTDHTGPHSKSIPPENPTVDKLCTTVSEGHSSSEVQTGAVPRDTIGSPDGSEKIAACAHSSSDSDEFENTTDTEANPTEDNLAESVPVGGKLADDDIPIDFDVPVSVEEKIEAAIVNWSVDCPNVPNVSITNLLHHLNEFFPSIHLTASTLTRHSSDNVSVVHMHSGRYAHFKDWKECIKSHLLDIAYAEKTVYLNINVDGLPLFKDSRKNHVYPILVEICTSSTKKKKIVCAAIYISDTEGSNKMPCVNEFLDLFVDELSVFQEVGMIIQEVSVEVKINAFVCDAPARSDLKCIVGHSGYFSCERCTQKGTYVGGHVAHLETNSLLRTDEEFLNKTDANHHRPGELSCIHKLGIGLVSSFPLDYMHLVCIGITKRLLLRWKSSKKTQEKCHLTDAMLVRLDQSIVSFSRHIPSDFVRRLSGGMKSVSYWKATEFRLFLLYCGPIVLKDVLPTRLYQNFMLLGSALRLLLSDGQECNMENVRQLLVNFVTGAQYLYGAGFVSYNVHSLIHLPDDYMKFGNLNSVSCFIFENYLGAIIKGRLSGRNRPLEQIMRHVVIENSKTNKKELKKQETTKKFYFGQTVIKRGLLGSRDNCVMLKCGKIGIIEYISSDALGINMFTEKSSLFSDPVDSRDIGIFKVNNLGGLCEIPLDDIYSKMLLVPFSTYYVALKLLHT